jgi:hypothetical protein
MTDVTEGWSSAEDAKERARESVRAAFERGPDEPPERTCRSCGHEAATWRSRCPACEKRYDRRLPWLSTRARWALAALAVALAGTVVIVSAPKVDHSKRVKAAQRAREQAARIRTETARLVREQRPVHGRAQAVAIPRASAPEARRIEARHALVGAFETAILAEARSRIATGELDGPVTGIHCGPLIRSPGNPSDEDDLTKPRGRYDCVVVKHDVMNDGKVVGWFGHPFVGVIDFRRGSYTFCKDNKVPGERGKALVKVRLAPECIGAEGQSAVLDGYLKPED